MDKLSPIQKERAQTAAELQQQEAGKMQSAFEAAQNFTTKDIWNISNRNFTSWGIPGYEIFRQYQDPLKQIEQRELASSLNKKAKKDSKHFTKRGSFLENIVSLGKSIPGPGDYKHWTSHYNTTNIDWLDPTIKERNRKLKVGKRTTYIDTILQEASKLPGVGKYNIRKTQKQIESETKEMRKRRVKINEKRNFLCESEYLGYTNPAIGQYQPHQIRSVVKKNLLKPKEWIKRHKSQSLAEKAKLVNPDAATYQPEPANFETFSKLLSLSKERKSRNKNLMGTSLRFPDFKKSKSQAFFQTPGPNSYNLTFYWKGKQEKNKEEKKNEWKNISKGIQKNIYYD